MRCWPVLVAVGLLVPASGCTMIDALPGSTERSRGPGALYQSYLAGSSDRILVELDYAPGARWDESTPAKSDFVDQLERITQKEVVVQADQDLEGQGWDYAYSVSELQDLHERHQDARSGNGTEVMHALFVQGEYRGSVAGVAFAPRAFAVFKGQIDENTCDNDEPVCRGSCPPMDPTCLNRVDPSVREWKVTRSVAIHEAGHLLGLVANPLPMVEDHLMEEDPNPDTPEDEAGDSHSSNESSVMYWKIANTAQLDDFVDGGEVPWRFGRLDVKDARAVQTRR